MAEEYATVRVAQGALRGRRAAAEGGGAFFSFQGVPYARPPVGPLRFQEAQPAEPWDGVRDALKEGSPCPQVDWVMKLPYLGDEDGLYINVYTPKLPSPNQAVRYAVMVWIHGGGFEAGSGDSDSYGPDYLVGEQVVVVTFNYRLGIFGFLSVEDGSVPSNLGMKDQVVALRWVKENIAAFGGDPDNVTIFGESAGGAAVHLHMLSPMSKGLFHKAIIQSGCAINPWALAVKPQELAFDIAKELGSNAATIPELIAFLRTAPARDLVEKYDRVNKDERVNRKGSFCPTIETNTNSSYETFLPDHPRVMMEKRQFHSVPVMIGLTSSEGIIILDIMNALHDLEKLKQIVQNLEILVPGDHGSKASPKEIAEKMKTFYNIRTDVIDEETVPALVNLTTDTAFTRGVGKVAEILAEETLPVFYYNFGFSGKLNFYKNFVDTTHLKGASHLDELGYLFATPYFKVPRVETDSREGLTRRRMLKLWTNFAKTGNPTPDLDPVIGVKWPRYTTKNPEYLDISDTLTVKNNLHKERLNFWNSL